MDWEIELLQSSHGRLAHPWLDAFFVGVTHLGDPPLIAVLVLGVWGFFRLRWQRREAYLTLFLAAATFLLVQALKFGLARARPALWHWIHLAEGYSFPSGHAAYSMAFYGWLGYLTRQRLLFGTLILLVGMSRMYLGVHWPTDVAAGWLLGGATLLFTIKRKGSDPRLRGQTLGS